ncbi:flagellar hook-associated protein FlgL [candidate division KSB1 bacterium]|nr:flagellar hook-associated protein FlgL [candidate division KSB1 bacterium]
MRVSDSYRNAVFTADVQERLANLVRIQREMGTGNRIFQPSEDTENAGHLFRTERSLAENAQYQRNIEDGQNWLNAADASLQSIVDLISEIDALAVAADNSSQNEQDRENTAIQIDQKLEALTTLINAQHNDRYLFGGFQTVAAPFTLDRDENGRITGAHATQETLPGRIYRRISEGEDVQINVPGSELFQPLGAAGTNRDLVYVLAQLRNTIANNNQPPDGQEATLSNEALRTALSDIRNGMVTQQTYVGSIGQRLNDTLSRLKSQAVDLTDEQEQAGGVDLTELVSRLATEQSAYDALVQISSRVLSRSLVDYIL